MTDLIIKQSKTRTVYIFSKSMLIEAYILSCWNDFMALYRSEGRKVNNKLNLFYVWNRKEKHSPVNWWYNVRLFLF